MPLPSVLVSLSHRNFRLIWVALLFSFTGSFMQSAALLWHVSILVQPNQKGLALGAVGLARIIPIIGLSLVSGVVADAWDRRRLLMVTQIAAAVGAGALAVLAVSGVRHVWPLYVLAALNAVSDAFDRPARQALVPTLVPREHLPNALSLNTTMLQLASVCGPAIGGMVIAGPGLGWAYVINALSFLVVFWALVEMRDVPSRDPALPSVGEAMSRRAALEGLRFVFRSPLIRSAMLLDFFATFFSSATALLPIFAQDILHVGATGYGWLYAAPAVGALVMSAILVTAIDRLERRGEILLWAVGVYGVATVVFGFSRSFWISFACLAASGAADTISVVIRNVIRHLETPNELRGRMVAVSMVFFMGGPQLGEMEAGLVANWFGAPFSVVSGGIGCLVATAYVAASTPVLRRHGLISRQSMP